MVKPGDVVRYNGHGNFGPYFCGLKEGNIAVVTDIFTHHTGQKLVVAFNEIHEGGAVTIESVTPTIINKSVFKWAPKFIVGDRVYIKKHDNSDSNIDRLYGKPCVVIDAYTFEDEHAFVYDIDEDLCVTVREEYLVAVDEYDPEIVPEDLGIMFI